MENSDELKNITLEDILPLFPFHMYWKTTEGKYLGCNDQQAKSLGFSSRKEIVHHRPFEQLPPDKAEFYWKNDEKIMASGKTAVLEETGIGADGNLSFFMTYKAPIKNHEYKVVGLFGVSFDISEMKKTEMALRKAKIEAETALNNIIANIPAYIYWKNLTGVYLGCNDLYADILGLQKGNDIVGKTDFDFLPVEQAEKIKLDDFEVIETRESKIEKESFLIGGKEVTMLNQKKPLEDADGQIIGILGFSFEVPK